MPSDEMGQFIDPNQVGEGELTEEQLIYKENIIDHYRHPHNKRIIPNPTKYFRDLNPLCGDTIEVFLIEENGMVVDIAFQGKGCAISQASMSMLTEEIKGKSTEEVHKMQQEDVLKLLNIPIGVVRMKCAMLGLRTTQKALR
jgi:nitrogen fixation protein NifU and related proteins